MTGTQLLFWKKERKNNSIEPKRKLDHDQGKMPPPSSSANPLPVVLVTGCSAGGIGFELARALAASGAARVIATARDVSKMEGLTPTTKPGSGILALLPLDVTDETSVSEAAARVLQLTAGSGVDVLVNNAGMTFKGTVLDSDVSETARLFGTNVFGLLRATQEFTRAMVLRGRGLVVNVGSATGYIHQATKSSYSASKHAVRCLTDCMRVELAPFNVRVFLVSPGYVATPIDDKAGEQGRWFPPKVGASPYAPPPRRLDKGGEEEASPSPLSAAAGAAAAAPSSSKPSSPSEEAEGFKRICTATTTSIFKYGPGAAAGSMPAGAFSDKLAAVVLREWGRTFPARGKVTRPPTAGEYLSSMAWLPTVLGGPVRHWREVGRRRRGFLSFFRGGRGRGRRKIHHSLRTSKLKNKIENENKKQAPYASVTYFIGGFLPLWLQDMLLSWSGGLIR